MAFLDKVLRPPAYGWTTPDGELSKPSASELFAELFTRINIFRSRKNWQAFSMWLFTLCLAPFVIIFALNYFSWPLVVVGFFYSMVGMGCYGTIWLHRYGTHGAYRFKDTAWGKLWRFISRNLVIRVCPDEIYIISHHVHHAKSELPGDPYNPLAGGLYCFLADTNHQPIATDLSEEEYARVCRLLERCGTPLHTYEEYLKWGTAGKPLRTYLEFFGNWAFWYTTYYLIGGHALATAIFGSAIFWAIGIRTFNFGAHGSGDDKRRDGVDFCRSDLSINQLWPGFVAGEWHNNHHLFATSANNRFLWYQLDIPFMYIRFMEFIGAVDNVRDFAPLFHKRHYGPWLEQQKAGHGVAGAEAVEADAGIGN